MRHAIALLAALAAAPALAADPAAAPKSASPAQGTRIEIVVNDAGFEPREVKLKAGKPATLVFTRKTERTCITAIDIPAENVKDVKLPLNQPVAVTVTPKKAGVEAFHCSSMAMGNGKLLVE